MQFCVPVTKYWLQSSIDILPYTTFFIASKTIHQFFHAGSIKSDSALRQCSISSGEEFQFCKQACKYATVDKLAIRVIESRKWKCVITATFSVLESCWAITVNKNNVFFLLCLSSSFALFILAIFRKIYFVWLIFLT